MIGASLLIPIRAHMTSFMLAFFSNILTKGMLIVKANSTLDSRQLEVLVNVVILM